MTEQNGLERSSATDELRRLLDERGIEWTEPNNEARSHTTYWTAGALRCMAVEFTDGVVSIAATAQDLTPEQAIEATLGRGTCHAIISDNLTESEGMGDAWADCSECGHLLFVLTDPNSEPPNFCPNCGRRIVEVDA